MALEPHLEVTLDSGIQVTYHGSTATPSDTVLSSSQKSGMVKISDALQEVPEKMKELMEEINLGHRLCKISKSHLVDITTSNHLATPSKS